MNTLKAQYIADVEKLSDEALHKALSAIESHEIGCVNWAEFPYKPSASFRMAYSDKAIAILFEVKENHVRAAAMENNGPVWQDSCVEFFVTPGNAERYFNFEMNCGGTILLYHIKNLFTKEYELVPEYDLATIERYHTMPKFIDEEITEPVTWYLGFGIPIALFEKYSKISRDLSGQVWKANFTKCADRCSNPAWLSWQQFEKCSFHQPDKFGDLVFE
jgi:hypothetical protein